MLLLLMCFLHGSVAAAEASGRLRLVRNLLEVQDRDVSFFSDFTSPAQSDFLSEILEDIPVSVFTVHSSSNCEKTLNCSHFSPIYRTRLNKQASLAIIWVSKVQSVLDSFAATVIRCPANIGPGVYYKDNAFLYFNAEDEMKSIFSDEMVRRHKNVAVAKRINSETYVILNYNLYEDSIKSRLWSDGDGFARETDFFPDFPMSGYPLRVGQLPYANHAVADVFSDPVSPEQLYTNLTGFEVEMIEVAGDVLNFTRVYSNPADQEWGQLGTDGNWSGLVGCLVQEKCDVIISAIYVTAPRYQVMVPTAVFDYDAFVLASPNPEQYINFLTLIYPLTYPVWIATLASLLVISFFLDWIAKIIEQWFEVDLRNWSSIASAIFFTLATILGQGHQVTNDKNARAGGAMALRISMATWLLSAVIVIAGYSGALRTFLISPSYEKAIETFADVLKSGLPWDHVFVGEEVETYMATTNDSIVSKIWAGKIVTPLGDALDSRDRLAKVLARKLISLVWRNDMDTEIYLNFSTPTGDPVIHISKFSPWYEEPEVFGFHPLNPWFERINRLIMRFIETGLVETWKQQTLLDMKRKESDGIVRRTVEVVSPRKLSLEDLGAVFITLFVAYLALLAFFAIEMLRGRSFIFKSRRPIKILSANQMLSLSKIAW